jgi:hypothetical protein
LKTIYVSRQGGLAPFVKGARATIARDAVFGVMCVDFHLVRMPRVGLILKSTLEHLALYMNVRRYETLRHSQRLGAALGSLADVCAHAYRNALGLLPAASSPPAAATPTSAGAAPLETPMPAPASTSPQFATNVAAAVCATVASAPLNFVRNIQYASPVRDGPTSIAFELRRLVSEVRDSRGTATGPWRTLQLRLRLGWGSLRVGAGMAVGAKVYESAQDWLATAAARRK